MKKMIIISSVIVILILAVWGQHKIKYFSEPQKVLNSATLLQPPKSITDFTLADFYQKPFTLKNLKNHWSFLFFGFTHCKSICFPALLTLNQTYQLLKSKKQNPMPQVIFVTINPIQDTNEVMKMYLSNINPNFIDVTGTKHQLDKLTKNLFIMYSKTKSGVIEHTGTILLVNPDGKLTAIFSAPQNARQMADDFMKIYKHHRTSP